MNKADLAVYIARKTGIFQKDALAIIDCLIGAIQEALIKGDRVIIRGLGKFVARKRSVRRIRSVATGQDLEIPAHRVPLFKPGRTLKDKLTK
jgi:DNA-binding protein HU-beta